MKPIPGSTVPRRARMKIAASPASAPEIANAVAITRFAGIPIRRATWKSCAAASMPSPCVDRRRNSVSRASAPRHVIVVITCSQPIVKSPMLIASLKRSGSGTPFWRGEIAARRMFWMTTEIAKLENRRVTNPAPRRGLNAIRSISTAATIAARIAAGTCTANGTSSVWRRYIVYAATVTSSPWAKLTRPRIENTIASPSASRA